MAQKKIKRQSILRDRRRRAIMFRLGISLGVLIFLFFLILICSWQSYFRIDKIKVTGNMSLNENNLILATDVPLSNNYGSIWPKNFFAWYPRQEIKEFLETQFPRILDVNTGLAGFSSINLEITEKKPIGVWCGLIKTQVEPCYLVDKDGFIFDKAPNYSGSLFVHYYGPLNREVAVGANYLSVDNFQALKSFLDNLHNEDLDVTDIEYISTDDFFNLYIANGPRLLINTRQTYDKTLRNILVLLRSKELNLHDTKNLTSLSYIDLRFGNKISYKEKGNKPPTSIISASSTPLNSASTTSR